MFQNHVKILSFPMSMLKPIILEFWYQCDRGGGIEFDDIKQLRSIFCAVAPGIKVHNFNVN